ncbi:MAG TPA: SUF system Fe-S cluster assembly regulator [Terriglobales bacterium]|nr:SUF system Fe-S cluster assembly regulator [Terriglobales bacterium]
MIRIGKLTDYGLVLMSYVAKGDDHGLHTARGLAAQSSLPLPTVSKLLKVLLQSGFLISHRGIKGGYSLARDAQEISVAEIIAALEGPIGLTECTTTDASGLCDLEPSCPIKRNQQMISQVVRGALEKLSLSDLIHPSLQLIAIRDARGRMVPGISRIPGSMQ